MAGHNYTVMTRLDMTKELKSFLNSYVTEYNIVYRYMWHAMTSAGYKKMYPSEAGFVTHVCRKYNLMKRTVNSIKYDVKGRIRSLKALKETELNQLLIKINRKEEKVSGLADYINKTKPVVAQNKATDARLEKYRRAKQSLYYQKNRLNKMKQKAENLEYRIKNGILKLGFGGRHMFGNRHRLKENGYKTSEKWYNDYVKCRDRNIFYLGSSDETCGNQMFQLTYQDDTDDFTAKIRKENAFCKDDADKYLIIEHINFKHLHDELKEIVKSYNGSKNGTVPLSFRFHRRGTKWYLQCIFDVRFGDDDYQTYCNYGVLGLDYNDGFIEMSETDECGNLVKQYHYDLKFHGTGKKAENEIRQTVSRIVKLALEKGKDIIIENLDFKRTKSKASKAKGQKGRKHNRMLHLFDYSRYKGTLENCCHRNRVLLQMVSPKDTSRIGKQKYGYQKKLNTHQAASYVIARRGQGFKDRLA